MNTKVLNDVIRCYGSEVQCSNKVIEAYRQNAIAELTAIIDALTSAQDIIEQLAYKKSVNDVDYYYLVAATQWITDHPKEP